MILYYIIFIKYFMYLCDFPRVFQGGKLSCFPSVTDWLIHRSASNSLDPPRAKSFWNVHIEEVPEGQPNPERLSCHQAWKVLTWMIWTEVINSSYALWVSIGKRSR